jgi:hypothetical protein
VKVLDLAAAACWKGGVLLRSMWVKRIDPENRAAHAIVESAKLLIVAYREGLVMRAIGLSPNTPSAAS